MKARAFLPFAGKVILAHAITYLVVGATAYSLMTKEFYEGADPAFASFMRTPGEPELWRHVMTWFIPAQILRGLLIAIALYPFLDTLSAWSYRKRFLGVAGLYLVLGFWAATVAAPGTIDGLVYLRPSITLRAHLMVQPEIVAQGCAMAAWVAWWIGGRRNQTNP